jgi:hypothetical protein
VLCCDVLCYAVRVQMNPIVRAVEPAACPSLTKGTYTYDYGDSAGVCVYYFPCVSAWVVAVFVLRKCAKAMKTAIG